MLFWWNHPKKEFCCSNNFGKNYIKSLPHENLSYLLAHLYYLIIYMCICGFPSGASSKESACKCRRLGFNPRFRKIPWRRKLQPTPVFLPRKSQRKEKPGGLQSMGLQSWTQLRDWTAATTELLQYFYVAHSVVPSYVRTLVKQKKYKCIIRFPTCL